jgi:hypothetical protein
MLQAEQLRRVSIPSRVESSWLSLSFSMSIGRRVLAAWVGDRIVPSLYKAKTKVALAHNPVEFSSEGLTAETGNLRRGRGNSMQELLYFR